MRRLRNYYPICFVDTNILLMYKYGYLFLINIETNDIIKKRKVINSVKENYLSRFDLFFRALRLGVRLGAYIGDSIAIIVIGKRIYEVDINTLRISDGCDLINRPLKFGVVKNVKGFDDGIYFGDYMSNFNKEKTSIYKRTGIDSWQKVYTFEQGEVNHIHNIIPDLYRNCLWILTGDFDDAAAIWCAKDNFKFVEPIFRGKQIYRSCVAFVTEDGLTYMTDTPFENNYICRIKYKFYDNKWVHEKITSINGSCIYGTKLNEKHFVFQTTVESDGRNSGNLLNFIFERKRGAGIKSNYVCLYSGTPDDGFKIIYKQKKDFWPFALFQFGTFQFPEGVNDGDSLPFYSMAVKKYNQTTQIIKLK